MAIPEAMLPGSGHSPPAAGAGNPASFVRRWCSFIRERFPLASHIPMVAVFTAANGAAALYDAHGARLMSEPPAATVWLRAFLVTLVFFLRMRIFDEIKDLETDLRFNPSRPLARGLISVADAKRAITACVFVEFTLLLPSGSAAVAAWLPALAYSFLMYKEFFIGPLIRPHLTTYALTHTVISIGIGFTIAATMTGAAFTQGPHAAIGWLACINWMFFNVFEFSRKTYAAVEESPGVDTYSALFGSWGAWTLSASQIGLALGAIYFTPAGASQSLTFYAIAMAWVIPGLRYAFRPTARAAAVYRAASGVCIISFYAVLTLQFLTAFNP